jgi:hypothetical protein
VGTGGRAGLQALSETAYPYINYPAILNSTHGFCFGFYAFFCHDATPLGKALQENFYQQSTFSIGRHRSYL